MVVKSRMTLFHCHYAHMQCANAQELLLILQRTSYEAQPMVLQVKRWAPGGKFLKPRSGNLCRVAKWCRIWQILPKISFPNTLPILFGNIFNAKNFPFLKHQLCLLILTKFIKCRNFTKYSSDNVFEYDLLTAWGIVVVFHLIDNHSFYFKTYLVLQISLCLGLCAFVMIP